MKKPTYSFDIDCLPASAFIRESQLVGSRQPSKKKTKCSLKLPPSEDPPKPETVQAPCLIPIGRSTMWRKIKQGKFPQPIKISDGINGWRCGEIREWLSNPKDYVSTPIGGKA
jgi:predicted DNA-binding transcriptional regulator AlpA